ncbi:MAG: hypothetical protein ACRDA8_18160, partial [Shewanella sp.]
MLTHCIIRLIFVQTQYHLKIFTLFIAFNLLGCKENAVKPPPDPTLCAFQQGECVKNSGNVTLRLALTPPHAPSEKPITLKLLASAPITDVKIRLEGRDMFMGIIPVNMQQLDEMTYEGKLLYGSCSSGYMVWRGVIDFTQQGQTHTVS